jgi:hypothetical protein
MDGAPIQEGQLSQVQDDGLSRNHDPVDPVLKILNSRQVELASKQKISCWRDLDVKVARAIEGLRALPNPSGREGNRSGMRRRSTRRGLTSVCA